MFKFDQGDKVKDTITGFIGVVVGRTEWMNGCIRYVVQPIKLKDGAPQKTEGLDEEQLELVPTKKHNVKITPIRTGGERNVPSRGQVTPPRF